MHKRLLLRLSATSCVAFGAVQFALAADLARYRAFTLGADLESVVRQTGAMTSQAKVVQGRPALIQDLEWRPRPLGPSSAAESAREIVFSFYNGELYRIVVNYDRYEIEGLTVQDLIDAVSAAYGTAERPPAPPKNGDPFDREDEEVIARWQGAQHRWDLVRLSYGPTFRLVGILKRLEAPVSAAVIEAARLDEQEAPQREAARKAAELQAERTRLEKSRTENKPRFRP